MKHWLKKCQSKSKIQPTTIKKQKWKIKFEQDKWQISCSKSTFGCCNSITKTVTTTISLTLNKTNDNSVAQNNISFKQMTKFNVEIAQPIKFDLQCLTTHIWIVNHTK